jgi:molybdopterin synthase catalytic subunit
MSIRNKHPKKRITNATIYPYKIVAWVMDKKAGGTAVFIGSVREDGQMGKIVGIRYESYLEMAEDRMLRIEKSVLNKYKILRVKMIHRIGDLSVGEISVVVAVSAPHRAEAFRACRYVIERIKKEVPIWKKENLDGGIGVWVRK